MTMTAKQIKIKRYETYISKAQASIDRNKKKLAKVKAAK